MTRLPLLYFSKIIIETSPESQQKQFPHFMNKSEALSNPGKIVIDKQATMDNLSSKWMPDRHLQKEENKC